MIFIDYTDFMCEMARKRGHEFRKMFTRCNEFHNALCEHREYTTQMFCSLVPVYFKFRYI